MEVQTKTKFAKSSWLNLLAKISCSFMLQTIRNLLLFIADYSCSSILGPLLRNVMDVSLMTLL